jgi:serine/threonine-protein kinase RsbW
MSVPAMRQVLGDTLRRLGVSEDSVADILLAASEACTNVIRHAARSVRDYAIAATVDTSGCRVEVMDSGRPWRPPGRRRPHPASESGRGFEVMRACVDDVSLHVAPGQGTIVTLAKHIDWLAQGDDPLEPPIRASWQRPPA